MNLIFKVTQPIFMRFVAILTIIMTGTAFAQSPIQVGLNDLSAFKSPSKSWQIAGSVQADLSKTNFLTLGSGSGIIVNFPDKKIKGEDLLTLAEYGDIDLEFEYLMAAGANSGIYLQGRYEIQLEDTWGSPSPKSNTNGGIYPRWDDSKPEGQQGYGGYAPRQNASKAPGLWQKFKISFQAPRFDASGKKIANAVMLRVELNGVIIHDNVELSGPTRGSISNAEAAKAPLRFQGDHGAVAFKNIKITSFDRPRPSEKPSANANTVDPILIDASENSILRSFIDLPGSPRVVHAVSVGSAAKVHYTYDMDNAMLVQVWRGDFLNATPMWHDRGDGSSRPLGMLQRFGKPKQSIAQLMSTETAWINDTLGTSYKPKGYVIDEQGLPTFKYHTYGIAVSDQVKVLDLGRGISRTVSLSKSANNLYFRLADAQNIVQSADGTFVIDNQSYYLKVEDGAGAKAFIRDSNGRKELLIPIVNTLNYSILF
jgi:hypothetical protein